MLGTSQHEAGLQRMPYILGLLGNIRVILGIMEKKMETTTMGLGFRVRGLGFRAQGFGLRGYSHYLHYSCQHFFLEFEF